jgi:hypothetical protein
MIYQIRFRSDENKLVLQVLDTEGGCWSNKEIWRDAQVEDALEVAKFCRSTLPNEQFGIQND